MTIEELGEMGKLGLVVNCFKSKNTFFLVCSSVTPPPAKFAPHCL